MAELVVPMTEFDSQRLEHVAKVNGKTVQALIHEWIKRLLDSEATLDLSRDPVFQMEGYDSEAPVDLSANLDRYLYGARDLS